MISVKLLGGLGNQMFQYAMGRHLALKNKTSLVLDVSELLHMDLLNYTPRDFELGVFNIKDAKKVYKVKLSYVDKIYRKFFAKYINENGHQFNRDILDQKGNIFLSGFWQTEKYFEDIKGIIREDFSFKNQPNLLNLKFIDEINKSDSVSIHFRRGDYLTNPLAIGFHSSCGPSYYYDAIDIIKKKVKNPHFFVFSDDIEWVRENFKFENDHSFIDVNHNENSFEDMRLMAACKHNIIANSTFSWWGAWLNSNLEKTVVAPVDWFKDKSINTSDIIPNEWIKI